MPNHDLSEMKQLILENPKLQDIATSSAIRPVTSMLALSIVEARTFILNNLLGLESDNFSDTVFFNGMIFDVYGKVIHDISWYIKFSLLEDPPFKFVYAISFHPTKKPLKTMRETLDAYSQKENI